MTSGQKILTIVGVIMLITIGFLLARKAHAPTNAFGQPEIASMVTDNSTTTYATIELSYPKSNAKELPEVFHFVQKAKEDFIRDYANPTPDQVAMSPFLEAGQKLEMNMTTHLATSSKTVSYIIELYEYTGGAHGGTSVSAFTYDGQGRLVTIERLFKAPYLQKLSSLSRAYFERKFGGEAQTDMIKDGTEPKSENFSVWYPTDKTINFIFGQYQVGPYAIGIQEYPIPKEELKDLLAQEFQ